MKFRTEGLIIKEQNIGEQDKLVFALTKSNGVIRAFVKGAKNIKNGKCAAASLLSYSRLTIYKGRGKLHNRRGTADSHFLKAPQ